MKKYLGMIFIFSFCSFGYSQKINLKGQQGGLLSAGVRTTMNVFGHHNQGVSAFGAGGQFRLQFANRVNSEWFFDYTRGSIGDIGNRTDWHVGWSVMYYFTDKISPPVKPYILAGHCFDRTVVRDNRDPSIQMVKNSSAIQAGAGVHFNLTERLDITLVTNYMFHLGKDLHAHAHGDELHLELKKGTGIEGHVLINLGINFKIADLWDTKKK
ncbi:MAG: hypothetical protein WC994_08005 [Brumimicrobium sp.]